MTAKAHYDRKRAESKGGFRTGFCNPSWSLDTPDGRASHDRCTFVRCECECHAPRSHVDNADRITKPGLIHGMSDEVYHGDPVPGGSLSSTFARLLTRHVPAKAVEVRKTRKPTKAMNLGKAAHAHALGAGPELIVWQYDGRTKDGKAERAAVADVLATESAVAVTEAERDQILGMATALRAHPEVAAILDASDSEVSGFWQEGSTWLRARYDLLGKDRSYDYKTCEDASRRGFSKSMGSYGYHQQADFYQRGLRALKHPAGTHPMRFICQETTAPYLVQIHTPDDMAMEVARELNDRAIRLYTECSSSGVWPGYEHLTAEPTALPGFYFYDNEDALPDLWKPSADLEMVV
jgi:hypothetical protein